MKARTCPGYECAAGAHSQVRHILIILQISLRLSASAVRGIQNGHTEPFQMPTGDTLRFDFRVLFTGVGPPARFTALRHDFRAGLADVRLSAGKKTKFLNRGQEHEWWWKFSLEGSEQKETRSDLFSCTWKMLDVPLNLYHPRCHSALHTPQPGGVSPELCFVECEPRTCELCVMHREQIAKSLRHNFGLLHRAGKAKCDFSHN